METDLFVLEVTIPGINGDLEGRLLYDGDGSADTGVIICPPHPLLAGNLDNNVVRAVAGQMARRMPVLLFNYPAVGKSYRPRPELPLFEYWNELDQKKDYDLILQEVKQVTAWSAGYFPGHHLVGYSFGARMALHAISPRTLSYTAIAPPLTELDFTPMFALTIPAHVVMAENDGLLATPVLWPPHPTIARTTVQGTDHFFLRHEARLADLISTWITASACQSSVMDDERHAAPWLP